MVKSPLFPSWLGWWGLIIASLFLLGQTELLATVMPNQIIVETTPIGFISWEIWMLVVGIALVRLPRKLLTF